MVRSFPQPCKRQPEATDAAIFATWLVGVLTHAHARADQLATDIDGPHDPEMMRRLACRLDAAVCAAFDCMADDGLRIAG